VINLVKAGQAYSLNMLLFTSIQFKVSTCQNHTKGGLGGSGGPNQAMSE